ncbi:S1 family peptidase [Colwellia sp. MEBiC06753]
MPIYLRALLLALMSILSAQIHAHNMVELVKQIKPAVVGVGVHAPLSQPQNELRGSGFVIGNGQYVATNHHVVPDVLDSERLEEMVVFVGSGKNAKARKAQLIASSRYHDLAILKVEGERLPAMKLAADEFLPEGSDVGFTGFPIGAILGLYPVTHRAMLASITPVVIPVKDTREMSLNMLKRLREPYMVYQLDGTAYPGNSGSALYNTENGEVVAVINKVFVQGTKEAAITNPSGITYAIPVRHLRKLMRENKIPEG